MRRATAPSDTALRPHRIVFENYGMRAPSFAAAFVILVLEMHDRDLGWAGWGALVLVLLVYPQLAYLWGCRARHSLRAELNNMVLDSFLIGLVVAGLAFPFWLSFTMWLASALNNTLSRSARGMLYATVAFACGAAIPVLLFGWRYAPAMGVPGTVLCALSMSMYLFAIGNANYVRNEQLRSVRARLQAREQSLEATNLAIGAAYRQLSLMGEFGREITATLDRAAVMKTVYRLVAAQMPVDGFRVGLHREGEACIDFPFVMQSGQACAVPPLALAGAPAHVRECLEHGKPVRLGRPADDGLAHPASVLLAPLSIKDRVAGLLLVECRTPDAYQPLHLDMLATLAAYTAVALDNADAYEQLAGALQALQSAQQQLVMNERMASIGTLTAGVAHEINNPVNFSHAGAQTLVSSIGRFHASLLTLAGEDAEPAIVDLLARETGALLGQVGVIVEGTTRIRDIVRDLRNFSRLDEARRKTVSINDTLMSTVRLIRMHYARSTTIVCRFEREIALECWPAQLNQVFMNLIVNACDAIEERGRQGGQPDGLLRIDARIEKSTAPGGEGEDMVIDFADNGCGIGADAIGRIFDPFYTTKPQDAGTGLGLAISSGIVRAHGGDLAARSTPGEGSCLTVRIPLRQPGA